MSAPQAPPRSKEFTLHTERHVLMRGNRTVQLFHPELTELQHKVLDLLGVPRLRYQPPSI
jgi:hypothetical protein